MEIKNKQVIKDLSEESWSSWRDDKTLIKFLRSKSKMNATELCKEVNNKFNLNATVSELGGVKNRHNIHSPKRPKDKWKEGMDIDKAFEEGEEPTHKTNKE